MNCQIEVHERRRTSRSLTASTGRIPLQEQMRPRLRVNEVAGSAYTDCAIAVWIGDDEVNIVGMEFVIHNLYDGAGWKMVRKWCDDSTDAMLAQVASHVADGLYKLFSFAALKTHVRYCVCK